jgi:hypothetical protein
MSILNVIGSFAAPVVEYFKQRAELKSKERIRKLELDDALHSRKLTLIAEGFHADAAWEIEQIKNSGWKDEFVLIVLAIPLVGVFVPPLAPYMLTGFNILQQTPDWYRWLIMLIFTAIYGIRIWRRQQTDT